MPSLFREASFIHNATLNRNTLENKLLTPLSTSWNSNASAKWTKPMKTGAYYTKELSFSFYVTSRRGKTVGQETDRWCSRFWEWREWIPASGNTTFLFLLVISGSGYKILWWTHASVHFFSPIGVSSNAVHSLTKFIL